jgi:hypothetical protein
VTAVWSTVATCSSAADARGTATATAPTALLQQAHDFAKESGMGRIERDSERLLATLN